MLFTERLPGGPTLLFAPNGQAPVTSLHLWLRVGAAREGAGLQGAAHLLEHMLFKGTDRYGPGEVSTRMEELGGELNAYTSLEQTVVHATVPAASAQAALELIADIALRPRLDAAELRREKKVVIEEIRGAADDPGDLLTETLRAHLWPGHSYGRPVLGTEASVSAIRPAALRAFHARYYRASNAILAVSGQLDPGALREAALRHLPSDGGAPAPVERRSPALCPAIFALDPGFEERLAELAWPALSCEHPDLAALDVLSSALGDGVSAPLLRRLRSELDLVLSCSSDLEADLQGGAFAIGLSARQGCLLRAVEEAICQVGELGRLGLGEAELRRARAGVRVGRLREQESADGRAHNLANYEAWWGDPEADRRYDQQLMAVSGADLRRVAGELLRPERLVAGALGPAAEVDAGQLEAAIARGWARGAERAVVALSGGPGLVKLELAQGLRLVVEPSGAPMVGLALIGLGGQTHEGLPGLAEAWSQLLCRGAGELDAQGYAAAAEERGVSLRPWSARNTMGVGGACPPEELPVLLELLGLALREARFEEGEIARTRADFEEGRRMVMDDAGMLAEELVWRGLFPGHAWGRPSTGSAAANARLSAARLRRLSERVFCGENLVLAVSGDIDPQALRRMVRAHLGALPRGKALLPDPPAQPLSARRRRASVPRADSPAHLMIGLRAAGHGQPEEAAWQVLAGLLGGASGGAGRLFLRLREDLGLAYEVGASLQRGLGGGALICSIAADPSREAMAREGLWGELERLAQQGPAPGEVERVARGIVEGAVLGLQSSAARADHLATHERLGPGAELAEEHGRRPLSVRPEEVAALAKRALRRELAVEVRVGPRAAGQADEAE